MEVSTIISVPKIVTHYLERHGINGENEIYLHLFSLLITVSSLGNHIFLLILFAVNRINFYSMINIGSIFIYCTALFCHRKKAYNVAILLVSAEVILYTSIVIIFSGVEMNIAGNFLLIIILQAIVPYASPRFRMSVSTFVVLIGIIVVTYGMNIEPRIQFHESFWKQMTVMNIALILIETMVLLYIGEVIRHIIEQVNQLKMAELSTLANVDPLTGLNNRRYADVVFDTIAHSGENPGYCVAILDIDDFKYVNDTYGHACGDTVLVFLSEFIKLGLRNTDYVFRWGGEEFLIILKSVTLPSAYTILEKLRSELEKTTIETNEANLKITVTIGVTAMKANDIQGSIKICDENLYIGKRQTKNVVVAA